MKTLLLLALLGGFTASAASISNEVNLDDGLTPEASSELDVMDSWGWAHIGCVSQINSASSCQRKAASHGYSQSRIQQDYICPPKMLYSCYGR